jgi:ABC-type dipeptide/oligopeptide/nickel transport system ATPase component
VLTLADVCLRGSGKSELALAIMEFYKQKGESIKLN